MRLRNEVCGGCCCPASLGVSIVDLDAVLRIAAVRQQRSPKETGPVLGSGEVVLYTVDDGFFGAAAGKEFPSDAIERSAGFR